MTFVKLVLFCGLLQIILFCFCLNLEIAECVNIDELSLYIVLGMEKVNKDLSLFKIRKQQQ